VNGLDRAFETEYHRDLTVGQRDDLTVRWANLRDYTAKILTKLGIQKIPARPLKWNRRFKRLRRLLEKDIPELRSGLGL
jgi:hypothetical protein